MNSLTHLYKKDIEFEGPILCVPAVKGARAVVNVANRHRPHRHWSPLTMSATEQQRKCEVVFVIMVIFAIVTVLA